MSVVRSVTLPQFEPLLSDAQAGELLGLHPKTVQRLARAGEIPAIRIGRYWRFRTSELDAWLETLATGHRKPVESDTANLSASRKEN